MVVLTADHGEEFLEHDGLGHHLSGPAFEELIRVPLLINLPSSYDTVQGKVVEDLVRLVDIVPTVLDFTGLNQAAALMDGKSLRSLLEGKTAPERVALVNAIDFSVLRSRRWKYRHVRRSFEQFTPGEALFDIIADPLERHDLAGEQPEVLRELRLRYAEIMTRLRRRGQGLDGAASEERSVGKTPVNDDAEYQAEQEQLRHLGYVDD
jgi:arylsulfatase A-like enzyme